MDRICFNTLECHFQGFKRFGRFAQVLHEDEKSLRCDCVETQVQRKSREVRQVIEIEE